MKNKYIILTKVADNNPSEVLEGILPIGSTMIQGYLKFDDIFVGSGLYLYPTLEPVSGPDMTTSDVVEFDKDNMILKTINSIYKILVSDY
jgi:hypothetical protein